MIQERTTQLYADIQTVCDRAGHRELPRVIMVTKYTTLACMMDAYNAGARVFGESKVQDLLKKTDQLPSDIEWHFIGHLQRNKVKDVVGRVALIHSVDTVRLAREIDRSAREKGIVQECLLQYNASQENTKFGFRDRDSLISAVHEIMTLSSVRITGLMTIGSFDDDADVIRHDFASLRELCDTVRTRVPVPDCRELSMGMSSDWRIAVEEGATLLRIGSYIFK